MSWLTHLIIHLSESPHHLESGAGALGTSVTVAIWHPVRGCDIYSRPLVRVPSVSPAHSAPEICSIDLRKWGICLTLKIALRNYTDPNWPLRQCQVTPVFVAKLSERCAYFMRGERETQRCHFLHRRTYQYQYQNQIDSALSFQFNCQLPTLWAPLSYSTYKCKVCTLVSGLRAFSRICTHRFMTGIHQKCLRTDAAEVTSHIQVTRQNRLSINYVCSRILHYYSKSSSMSQIYIKAWTYQQ